MQLRRRSSAVVADIVDAVRDHEDPEPGATRAIERRRRHRRRVDRGALVPEPDRDAIAERLGHEIYPLIGAALIGVLS